MMSTFNILQVAVLIVTGVIVSITDLKNGKIQNRNLIIALSIGLLINILIFNRKFYLIKIYLCNVIVICVIGIVLYSLKIWAGGDSKFLILIGLLYPTEMCWELNGSRVTIWIVLLFTFIVSYVYLIFDTIIYYYFNKKTFNITCLRLKEVCYNYCSAIVFLGAFNHIYMFFLFPNLQLNKIIYVSMCIIFIWGGSSRGIFKNCKITICVAVFDLLMSVITGYIPVSTEWKTYVIVIISMILKVMLEKYNYEEIATKDIKAGMILSQITTLYFQNSKIKGLPGISDETLKSRLTYNEVESIKKWGVSKYGKKKIVIVRKIPFAIFITIGLISYIILGGILRCY